MRMEEPIRADDVSRASAEAEAHARAGALSALADDVLFRQAEGRRLLGGADWVRRRADAHGVLPEDAETAFGNLLDILERGPRDPREHGLVAAFAVRGFAGRLRKAPPEERPELARRFVRHADWLELATSYRVYPFVHGRLGSEGRLLLRDALVDAVSADADSRDAGDPGVRARNAARLTVLEDFPEAEATLRRLADELTDAPIQTLAASLVQGEPLLPRGELGPRIEGRRGPAPRPPLRNTLRLLFGVAAIQWLGRLLGRLVALERPVVVVLTPTVLRIQAETRLLGRRVREDAWSVPLAGVLGAVRHARWPAVHLLVGAVALAAGVFAGGLFALDAARTGETYLLFAAAGVLLVGAGLDLGLDVLLAGRRARVAFELDLGSAGRLSLTHVDLEAADHFLDALEVTSRAAR
jgi:hypothetical protein